VQSWTINLSPVALGFDFEHGPAVFLIEESDPFDQPGKAFDVHWWLDSQLWDSAEVHLAWQRQCGSLACVSRRRQAGP